MNLLWGDLAQLTGMAEPLIFHFALVFMRVGGAVMLLPALGDTVLPQRIKLCLAVAMTAVVAPATPQSSIQGVPVLLSEAAVGLMFGMGLRFLVLGLQTAGTLIAQSVSLAQMFSGTGPEPQPIVSTLLVLAGTAIFMAMDGLTQATGLLVVSYELVSPGQLPDPGQAAHWAIDRGAAALGLAFSLAAPFMLAALLYNLALGVINRAMPALMVVFIGAPALTLGGLILLAVAAPMLLAVWAWAMAAALAQPFGS